MHLDRQGQDLRRISYGAAAPEHPGSPPPMARSLKVMRFKTHARAPIQQPRPITTGLGFLEQSKPHPHSRSRTWKSLSMTTASAPKMVPSPTAMGRPATTLTIGRPTNVAAHENRSPSSDASHLRCKDPAARVLLRRADLTSEFSISHTR